MSDLDQKKSAYRLGGSSTIHAHSVKLDELAKNISAIEGVDKLARKEAATLAAIEVLVTKGYGPHRYPVEVNKLLPKEWWFRYKAEVSDVTGGYLVLLERMAKGGVLPQGRLGVWSPDLWAGLRMSGSLFQTCALGSWRTAPTKTRPALIAALQACGPNPLSFRMRVRPWKSSWGACLRLGGLWAAYLGADDPEGVGVLRGVLCGARKVTWEGRTWAGVPVREATIGLAKGLGVPVVVGGEGFGRAILFSPFWGALLSPDMPLEIGEWYRGWYFEKAGMCPLLPWVFFRGAVGWKYGNKGKDFPLEVVPSLVHRETLWQEGIKLGDVMELGVRELGVTRVDVRMREAWLRWMEFKGFSSEDFRYGKAPIGLREVKTG